MATHVKFSEFPKLQDLENKLDQEVLFPVIIETNGKMINYIADANDIVDLFNNVNVNDYYTKDEIDLIKANIIDSIKSATITIYTHSETVPEKPVGGSYDFTVFNGKYIGFSDNLAGWTQDSSKLTSPIWQSTSTFYINGSQTGWSIPSHVINTEDLNNNTEALVNEAKAQLVQLIAQAKSEMNEALNNESAFLTSQINQNASKLSSLVGRVTAAEATMSSISQKTDELDSSIQALAEEVAKHTNYDDTEIWKVINEKEGYSDDKVFSYLKILGIINEDGTINIGKTSIDSISVTVDANSGTPSATASITNGVAAFDFHNLKGASGKSAYELAMENGFEGTVEEWLASLKGADGVVGENGADGKDGVNGADGHDGKDGVDGKSAYDLWKEIPGNENKSLNEFFETYKGQDGTNGTNGQDGEDGVSITSVVQTTIATADSGKNIVTVTLSNGTTSDFEILNGSKGTDGAKITSVVKTGTNNLVDTYTITLSDSSTYTFTVTNGSDGTQGVTPKLKVENDGVVYVSYNEGTTWTNIGTARFDQGGVTNTYALNIKATESLCTQNGDAYIADDGILYIYIDDTFRATVNLTGPEGKSAFEVWKELPDNDSKTETDFFNYLKCDLNINDSDIENWNQHISNTTIHVTASERTNWNAKQDALSEEDLARIAAVDGKANSADLGTAAAKDVATDAISTESTDTNLVSAQQVAAFIKSFNKTDAAIAGQYVKSVSQDDGKITVSREAFPTAELNDVVGMTKNEDGTWSSADDATIEAGKLAVAQDIAKTIVDDEKVIAAALNEHEDRISDLENTTGTNHSHGNKNLLDTYTQTEEDLADAVSKKHSHTNATELAKISDGDVAKWNAKQDAIAENTYDTYGAASTVKSEIIGTSADKKDANTIYGAKAYADSLTSSILTVSLDDSIGTITPDAYSMIIVKDGDNFAACILPLANTDALGYLYQYSSSWNKVISPITFEDKTWEQLLSEFDEHCVKLGNDPQIRTNYQSLVTEFNAISNRFIYNAGQTFYFTSTGIPDLYISEISNTPTLCTIFAQKGNKSQMLPDDPLRNGYENPIDIEDSTLEIPEELMGMEESTSEETSEEIQQPRVLSAEDSTPDVSTQDFIEAVMSSEGLQIGYYIFRAIETKKEDLSNYVTKDQIPYSIKVVSQTTYEQEDLEDNTLYFIY